MISMPNQSGGNLGSALALWNMFSNSGAGSPPSPAAQGPQGLYDPSNPPPSGTGYNPATNQSTAPPPANAIIPQDSPNWSGTQPWFDFSTPLQVSGKGVQPSPQKDNSGKASGILGALGGAGGAIAGL